MKKVDRTVLRETGYVALWTVLLSALMEAVFLIVQKWDLTVLWGNLLGGSAAVLNFFLMGITVQQAVTKDKKNAASLMKLSQMLRFLLLIAAGVLGALLSCFNLLSTLIALFVPRIAAALRPLFMPKQKKETGSEPDQKGDGETI